MTLRLLRGDMRATLAGVEPGSVQTCITSPPYYGLRSYNTPPLVWGGDAEHEHLWTHTVKPDRSNAPGRRDNGRTIAGGNPHYKEMPPDTLRSSQVCTCGAWLGHLGLEPTPELFVQHIVECFRAVRRVLRDDGTVWCNLGDSYAGSGKGPTGHNGIGNQVERQGFASGQGSRIGSVHGDVGHTSGVKPPDGLKAKDLMMMPARVAMALQADGWYLRSAIPWLKRNAMPESVTDRPATSVEFVFLLSKSSRYFYDPDAVRVAQTSDPNITRGKRWRGDSERDPSTRTDGMLREGFHNPAGRNRRNGDWWFESWQGLLLDSDDLPLALVVNPAPYKDAHYATFPPKLVEPMIKASTSERGCCAECGAPWARVTSVRGATARDDANRDVSIGKSVLLPGRSDSVASRQGITGAGRQAYYDRTRSTTGWQPTCKHTGDPVPQTVLDPFAGANTTLLVADRLGRNGLGCELSESYSDMGSARLVGDAPMFVQLESA